ncbi:MAG: sel1 repeat family protein, partial [Thermoguttaceae bacterium]|nr:sel1 repeat family protein [Thermoguttaceae bacterium]
ERQAARWFRRAARAGDAVALYEFGLCRADGHGVEPDLARAALAFRRAARLGLESAAVAYGLALLYGRGVPTDVSRGKRVLERAARRGSGRAKGALRQFERAGKPVPKSSDRGQEANAGKSNALATEFSLTDLPLRRRQSTAQYPAKRTRRRNA